MEAWLVIGMNRVALSRPRTIKSSRSKHGQRRWQGLWAWALDGRWDRARSYHSKQCLTASRSHCSHKKPSRKWVTVGTTGASLCVDFFLKKTISTLQVIVLLNRVIVCCKTWQMYVSAGQLIVGTYLLHSRTIFASWHKVLLHILLIHASLTHSQHITYVFLVECSQNKGKSLNYPYASVRFTPTPT